MKKLICLFVLLISCSVFAANPKVVLDTTHGEIEIELFEKKAPITVKNFLRYVEEGFYSGTIFHRVIDNFMIQGGGFTKEMAKKGGHAPIKNEAANNLTNEVGTIAMARTGIIDSATSQFFINVKDNSFLNHRDNSSRGYGYAVFGKVTKGMTVVNRIKQVRTTTMNGYQDVPVEPVVIKTAKRKQETKEKK